MLLRSLYTKPLLIICLSWLVLPALADSLDDQSWMLYDDSEVAVIHITVGQEDLEWMYLDENLESDSLHPAVFHFQNAYINETVDDIGFRLRGNTSRYSAKKSFKVSFNTFVPGREFYGVDKMNLNGEHNDPSIIRSKLCWDLFGLIDEKASRAAHTAVYINGIYFGLYISIEHIDDEFLDKNYIDDSGNLWKCLYPADLVYKGGDPDLYKEEFWGRRAYDLKTNEDQDDYTELAYLIDVINNTPDNTFADSLEAILNVTEVLKYFAMNNLVGGWDDYWFLMNNYYLYHEPSQDIFRWIPYDYDNTFGIDWFDIDWVNIDPYTFATIDEGLRPLVERIMNNDQYRNLYTHFLQFYNQHVYDLNHWEERIDSLKDMITPWAETDWFRTLDYRFTVEDFHNSFSSDGYSNQHVKRGLKEFITLKNQILPSQLSYLASPPNVYGASVLPHQPQPDDTIHVHASAFSSVGIDSVYAQLTLNDGATINIPLAHNPIDGSPRVEDYDRYSGLISPLGEGASADLQFIGVDVNGHTAVYPRSGFIAIQTPGSSTTASRLNELMAKNDNTIADDFGEYDDWVEIHNNSDETQLLDGLYLTDKPDNLTRWQFPDNNLILEPDEFIVIWCDNDPEQGPLHTNFKLDADGEFVALVEEDGVTVIDSISFGPQTADISYGRVDDGDIWAILDVPSPGASNLSAFVNKTPVIPKALQLNVYPNPLNPAALIQYNLTKDVPVRLIIYNLLGQKAATLVDERREAGFHSIQWNGNAVGSGIYLLRLDAGEKSLTRKIVVIK